MIRHAFHARGAAVFITLLTSALLLSTANAQDYPIRGIRLIAPVPAGGSVDALARIVAEKLQKQWGHSVVIENRPGASGNIGLATVARAAPDGYTLLFAPGQQLSVNKIAYPDAVDPDTLRPVSRIATNPLVLVVNPSVRAGTLKEFISYSLSNPRKLNYASGGNGGIPHLIAELFQQKVGAQLVKVSYTGIAPAMIDLVGGHVDLIFVDISTALEQINAGKLRLLAILDEERHRLFPDTPTMAEAVPGIVAETWFGMAAPGGTPEAVVEKLSRAVAQAINEPDVVERLRKMGGIEPIGSSPEAMKQHIDRERSRLEPVIRSVMAQP